MNVKLELIAETSKCMTDLDVLIFSILFKGVITYYTNVPLK